MICVQKFSRPEGIKGKEKYRLEHEAGLRLLSQALCARKGLSGLTVEELEKRIQKKPGGKPYFPEFPWEEHRWGLMWRSFGPSAFPTAGGC